MNNLLAVLYLINTQTPRSQRDIAAGTGLSLGKVNAVLRHLVDGEYLTIAKQTKKSTYTLTAKGLALLEQWVKAEQVKKIKLSSHEQDVKQAVILAAGAARGIDLPVCLLTNKKGQTILERTMSILINHGIEHVVLVAGYQYDKVAAFAQRYPQMKLVRNDAYATTGTMASLAAAEPLLTGDFLLVEGDLVFEERGIYQLIHATDASSLLITSVRHRFDEAMVEVQDGLIYKMSKDIHQFNRIDGEMIGLSKVSYPFFRKMMVRYADNENPYLNYEYAMMDVARDYRLGYVKLDDFLWGEIDVSSQQQTVLHTTWPRIRQKEKQLAIDAVRELLHHTMDATDDDIQLLESAGGMTNKNYKVILKHQPYIVRVAGNGTERFIDRHAEKTNSALANVLGLNVDTPYFDEHTGIKISAFIENAETLNPQTATYKKNMLMTTGLLRTLHQSDLDFENVFNVFDEITKYERFVDEVGGSYFDGYDALREKVMALETRLAQLGLTLCPCHIDTVPENFVRSGKDNSYLIDWEYSGMNDLVWDLAAHCLECAFDDETTERFLKLYYQTDTIDDTIREKLLIFQICQDFLWSVWTIFKEGRGDDFGTYGIDRYTRAERNMARWVAQYQ